MEMKLRIKTQDVKLVFIEAKITNYIQYIQSQIALKKTVSADRKEEMKTSIIEIARQHQTMLRKALQGTLKCGQV